MKKKLLLAAILIGTALLIVWKLASNKSKINDNNKPGRAGSIRIPVTVATVKEELMDINIVKTGSVAPFKEAKVISVANGNLQKLLFAAGDKVHQGQVLAMIDTRLLQLDLQKSESNVARLARDLKTYTELMEANAGTREKVSQVRQDYQDALNQSEQLRKQIADAAIKAPTNGVVSLKLVEEGVFVTAGTEITRIVNLSQVKVQINLTETEVYQVSEGQKVTLSADVYPGKTFDGTITYISPQASETHNYLVEITANNPPESPLRSGTFIYADFSKKTEQGILLIPAETLVENTREPSVYVVKNGIARLSQIKVGGRYGEHIRVLEGIGHGDIVVTSGQINLSDGTSVNISK